MSRAKTLLRALWRNDDGLTTVEYAVAGALIAGAVILAFTNLGQQVAAVITYLVSNIKTPS